MIRSDLSNDFNDYKLFDDLIIVNAWSINKGISSMFISIYLYSNGVLIYY